MKSVWSKLEETIRSEVEDGLSSVDQQTQDLSEELNRKNEQTQSGLQGVAISFDDRIQGTDINIQTTKALVETTQCGLQAKIVEITDDFIQGLDLTWHEFKTQLKEIKARVA
jgi:hypothetical protein